MKDVILYEMSFAKDFLNSLCFVSGLNLGEKNTYENSMYCKCLP